MQGACDKRLPVCVLKRQVRMEDQVPFSVAILAGGQSNRMGQDKALLKLAGKPVLQYVIDAVASLTDDMFLGTNAPQRYEQFNVPMVSDMMPGKASLGGIYTAIARARHPWVFIVACDMPLLNPQIITFLAGHRNQADVVAPRIQKQPETLHSFYHKRCLLHIKPYLEANRLKVIGFFNDVAVTYIEKVALQSVVPSLDFLTNVNTPQEFAQIEQYFNKR